MQVAASELVQVQQLVRALVLTWAQQLMRPPELKSAVEPLGLESTHVRVLRDSGQLELKQHRLPAAAQEPPPYLPALLMRAPY